MRGRRGAKAPWHLWLVGVLSLLWNAFGAYDYVMSNTRGEAYLREAGMSDAMIAHFNAIPTWMYVFWALGVWGAVLGSILLLARSRWAVLAFLVSLIGAVVSALYQYVLSDGAEAAGSLAFMPAVIVVVAAFLAWYAWWVSKRGLLR